MDTNAEQAEQEVERLLQGTAPAAPARAGFRDGLRRRFVDGRFDEEADLIDGEPGAAPAPAPALAFHRRPAFRLLVGGLAAAALILAIARLVPRTDRWRAVEVVGQTITLDGRTVRVADLAEIGPAIMEAELVDTGGTRLRLELADRLRLDVQEGTRFRPRELAHLVRGRPSRFELEKGEVFLWKNPEGGDGTITVGTSDVDVAVVGTVVGVMCFEGGTCVCVERGDATVSCCEMPVTPGHSHVTRSGHPCEDHTFPPGATSCASSSPVHQHACRLVHFADEL